MGVFVEMEEEKVVPLWCDEMPQAFQRALEVDGPAADLFVVNPCAVPWRKRRKIEAALRRKKKLV
jgi:hypothetical protein